MLVEVDRDGPPTLHRRISTRALPPPLTRSPRAIRSRHLPRDRLFARTAAAVYGAGRSADPRLPAAGFGASLAPTEDEIVQTSAHESAFTAGGTLRPLAQVRDAVRDALVAERRATLLRDWLAGLRRRADVNVLYIPMR